MSSTLMMCLRSISICFGVLFAAFFLLLICSSNIQADSRSHEKFASVYDEWLGIAQEGVKGPVGDWHYYWKDGFRIDRPNKNFTLRTNLSIMVDGGYIGPDEELKRAFPDLEGPNVEFRQLKVSTFGTLYDWAEFKLSIDFANVRDIQDEWIRFTRIPYIGHFTVGYMKEPFSLENWTSLKSITFMERSLPTDAFAPGRNFGIRRHSTALDQRMTWALGAFLNTGSFSDVGDSKDQISEANGWDLTARVTYLPLYDENGKRLLHLGLSYTHQFRGQEDVGEQLRTRPESRLTDDRLVDTGEFFTDSADLINAEFAIVNGSLSFQGEYFHVFEDADALDNFNFWGFYLFGSYFISGEHRNYGRQSGAFYSLEPKHDFRPFKGGWGAWELTSRFSYIDLNSAAVRGGKEFDFTAGLNWYLNKKTRFMFNYIRAKVEDRETPPPVDSGHADIFQARFQIEF
ncbi:MAG: porin [Desulfobacteraceae bacterium]|nr:porin [Desulfobacteraceae bacterium]